MMGQEGYSIEREFGEVKATLKSLRDGQDNLTFLLREFARTHHDDLERHEDQDERRFDQIWRDLGKLKSRVAYFSGGLALAIALFEAFFKR